MGHEPDCVRRGAPWVDRLDVLRLPMTWDEANAATLPLLHTLIAPDEERVSVCPSLDRLLWLS